MFSIANRYMELKITNKRTSHLTHYFSMLLFIVQSLYFCRRKKAATEMSQLLWKA